MVLAHLVDENNPISGKSLESLSLYYLKKPGKKKTEFQAKVEKILGWGAVPVELMCEYGTIDSVSTLELYEKLAPMLKAENLQKVWAHKEQFSRLVQGMEIRGVTVDTALAQKEFDRGMQRMQEIIMELKGRVPSRPKDLNSLLIHELGLPVIYKVNRRTGERRQTFDKDAMEQYDQILELVDNPIAKRVLEYRGWLKTTSSNYAPYLELLSPDGRIRCNYKLHGTRTGRMSCEKPNLQQIPRESPKEWNGNLKKVFVPEHGYSLMEFDYSQLEFRLGAAYAREPVLQEIFAEDRDVFTEMAEHLNMPRQSAKTLNYSIQYGAGTTRISNVFRVSPLEARKIIDDYYDAYPNIKAMSKKVQYIVYRYRKVPLWSGRFRHFDYPKKQAYKAFNSVIQGGAADIVEHVMMELHRKGFNTNECRMLLTVHDSVIFEIDNRIKDQVAPEIKKVMTDINAATGQEFPVKFAVDSKEWGKAA
jgi:DNA polymerase-1